MSIIQVQNMTFAYDGSYDAIFENVSFTLDTDWKTGFIGRNGRGKTTFLKLLMGWERPISGTIAASVHFDYFPFPVEDGGQPAMEAARSMIAPFTAWERRMDELLAEGSEQALAVYGELQQRYMEADGYIIDELITREAAKLNIPEEALQRPFGTLSPGERTRLTLAALFLKKNNFLLIDEPTNHLDMEGRRLAGQYLAGKKGFILVSHDRDFLDRVVDHVISVNRADIEVQQGNYSTWKLNRDRQDQFELARNESLKRDIARLTASAERAGQWSDRVEASKIGGHTYDRGYVGHKAAKMMQRSKSIERRQLEAAEEKRSLLKNLEESEPLKLTCPPYTRGRLIEAPDLTLLYASRAAYEEGCSLLDAGQYLDAIAQFSSMSENDTLYIEGTSRIREAQESYCQQIVAQTGALMSQARYEDAMTAVEDALTRFPEATTLTAQKEVIYNAYKDYRKQTSMAEAQAALDQGNLEESLRILAPLKKDYPTCLP